MNLCTRPTLSRSVAVPRALPHWIALASTVAALALVARPARAELWASSMGELLHTARRIEIVAVDAVDPAHGTWSVRVTNAIRGRAPGTRDTLPAFYEFDGRVAPGSTLLVVCDASQCPRAIGLEQPGGLFIVRAHEPGDGAWVLPPLVQRGSIGALARGAPAPPLCLSPALEFVDLPAAPPTPLRASISAADGTGTLMGAIPGAPASVRVRVGTGSSGHDADAIALTTQGAHGSVSLLGAAITITPGNGCIAMNATPTSPLARTPTELARLWTGSPAAGNRVLAAGVFVRRAGLAGPAGTGPVTIALTPDGSIEIDAHQLGVRGRVGMYEIEPGATRLGLSLAPGGNGGFPELLFEVPRGADARDAQSPALAVARSVQGGRAASWRVLLRRTAGEALPVGELRVGHPPPVAAGP